MPRAEQASSGFSAEAMLYPLSLKEAECLQLQLWRGSVLLITAQEPAQNKSCSRTLKSAYYPRFPACHRQTAFTLLLTRPPGGPRSRMHLKVPLP